MNEPNNNKTLLANVPDAVVHTKKSFSIVWLVPIVAALIGGWLAYTAISEKGPTITIAFKSAEGLEAQKTKIKYKNVEIGQVESIGFNKDLSRVVVTAKLVKGAEKYLTTNTRFWIFRAHIGTTGVYGLGTLFSGAYIGVDPGKGGAPVLEFEGLDTPPVVTTDLPGRHFLLNAETLSSLDIGSPVYFRQIKVGQVVAHNLAEDGKSVTINIFINSPYHKFVYKNTRFWNAGGLNVSVDATGVKVDTESFVTMMIGGIAFETPVNLETGIPAEDGDRFTLYRNHKSIYEKTYQKKAYWVLHFSGSVGGLAAGAPVKFRGIQVGKVVDIRMEFSMKNKAIRIPVLIEIEPERITVIGEQPKDEDRLKITEHLVSKGLRAQLKMGNLLTGQMFIELDMQPNAPPQSIVWSGEYPELPTMPTPIETIATGLARLIDRLDKLPIEQIGQDLQDAVQGTGRLVNSPELQKALHSLNEALKQVNELAANLNTDTAPAVGTTLEQTRKTLAAVEKVLGSDSSLNQEARRALEELAAAAGAIRTLADYLERHPEALLRGKGNSQ
ncbi:MAG: MlaD family protein [Pseudomonadota bacterium]